MIPTHLQFRMEPSGATAVAILLWKKAPKTCAAITKLLPISTQCWHGRNSGAEALLLTPTLINNLPQDQSENATTNHTLGDVMFGFEAAGTCHGGAGQDDASEICWIYGPAAQACYWLSTSDPSHQTGPFVRQAANLNVFAKIVLENGFYKESARLQRYGQQQIFVTAATNPTIPTPTIPTPTMVYTARIHWQWIFEEALLHQRRVNNSRDLPSFLSKTSTSSKTSSKTSQRRKPLRRPPAGLRVESVDGKQGGWYSSPSMARLGDKSDLVIALQEVQASWAAPISLVIAWDLTLKNTTANELNKQVESLFCQYSKLAATTAIAATTATEGTETETELYLLKPSNACGGSGIVFCQTIQQALKVVDRDAHRANAEPNFLEFCKSAYNKIPRWILQEHIQSMLIREGKKFHVRSYLVYDESNDGVVWLCVRDHEVRIAKEKYEGIVFDAKFEHLVNPNIHITNGGGGDGSATARCLFSEVQELSNKSKSLELFLTKLFVQLLPLIDKAAEKERARVRKDEVDERIEQTPTHLRRMAMCAVDVMLDVNEKRWYLLEVNTTAPGAPPSESVPPGCKFRKHLLQLGCDLAGFAMGEEEMNGWIKVGKDK